MDVLIGNKSGTVYFTAWNETIDEIDVGNTYNFERVKTVLFQSQIRLSLGSKGTVNYNENNIVDVNNKVNASDKIYERRKFNRYKTPRKDGRNQNQSYPTDSSEEQDF